MIDLQSSNPLSPLSINKVGVKNVRHPIIFSINKNITQATIANINMYVGLPENQRGTHMSRFLEILNEKDWNLSILGLRELLIVTKDKLKADSSFIEAEFNIFINKSAPVSKTQGLLDYKIKLNGELIKSNINLTLSIEVPVTTLCPCSKEISEYGAHNQRSIITVTIKIDDEIDIEQLIKLIEKRSSCELYSILKRSDEKFVTERAYDNPKFVEDIVREIASDLKKDNRIKDFIIESENYESIHNHSAYAMIQNK